MKRKIAILTQPLHDNYGGLFQAYALSCILKELGNDPIIINRSSGHSNIIRKLASKVKQRLIGNKYILNKNQRAIISKHTLEFRDKYFPNLSEEIVNNAKMYELNKMGFNAYVVGSDQCWRPRYSPNITNYFLDFAESQNNIKRIAYAASFGTDNWEYTTEQTEICKKLIQKFDAVSVREDTGDKLCKEYLNTNAVHVLDPTLLWARDFYDAIVKKEMANRSSGNLKVYVLDKTTEKSHIIQHIENKLKLESFEVMPKKRLGKEKPSNLLDYQFPSPVEWLRGYQDAKFVVADSFHGTVFAILYNIPFIALGNKERGMARFNSLLKMFDLEQRLLTNFTVEAADEILKDEINWNKVNITLEEKRKLSINFLKNSLN